MVVPHERLCLSGELDLYIPTPGENGNPPNAIRPAYHGPDPVRESPSDVNGVADTVATAGRGA